MDQAHQPATLFISHGESKFVDLGKFSPVHSYIGEYETRGELGIWSLWVVGIMDAKLIRCLYKPILSAC